MNNLNSILIEGTMVKNPILRTTPKGTSVCSFALASKRFYKEETGIKKDVGFFLIEAQGKLAESVNSLGKKGRCVRVVGRLRQDRWDVGDGTKRSRIVIVAEHVEFRPEFKKEGQPEEAPEEFTAYDDDDEVPREAETVTQPVEEVAAETVY